VRFHPGDDNVYAGKGQLYTLHYGHYLMGMNMTTDKPFELKFPAGGGEAKDLVSGKSVKPGDPVTVSPRSTVVLWFIQ